MKRTIIISALLALLTVSVSAQPQGPQAPRGQRPDPTAPIKEVVERVYNYLDSCTPYTLVDGQGNAVASPSKADGNSSFARGDFSINCYEWGVTYTGMLFAADVLKDSKYSDYVYERLSALGQVYPYIKKAQEAGGRVRMSYMHTPRFLDDCGAMCAAMCKASLKDPQRAKAFRELLDRWFNFCMYEEYRLSDGILARNRPTTNSVWLDDMYMGITPIAYRGALAEAEGDQALAKKLYKEAVDQILLFKKYLWVPEMGIFRHGWIEGMAEHPNYHWARCNGWAILTMCDVLDVIPEDTPGRDEVLDLVRTFLSSVAAYQSPNGLWHQIINNYESYLETSASAMFTYCTAHAVLNGWVDATAYRDIAISGWQGVATQVNEKGQVENTCVGTGLGWTNTFYANRPVSVFAAHGYGPVLLAATEVMKLYTPTRR